MRRAKVANNKFWKGRIEFWTNGRGFEPKEIRAERDCIFRMRRERKEKKNGEEARRRRQTQGGEGKNKRWEDSVDVKLVAEMEEETSRLTGETTSGGKGKVGSNQQVVKGVRVDVAGDGGVVAGRAGVSHDGAVVGCEPEKAEDSGVHGRVSGTQVVDRKERFRDGLNSGEVKGGRGIVAEGDDGAGVKGGVGYEIVVWRGGCFGCAERASVGDGTLKFAA